MIIIMIILTLIDRRIKVGMILIILVMTIPIIIPIVVITIIIIAILLIIIGIKVVMTIFHILTHIIIRSLPIPRISTTMINNTASISIKDHMPIRKKLHSHSLASPIPLAHPGRLAAKAAGPAHKLLPTPMVTSINLNPLTSTVLIIFHPLI